MYTISQAKALFRGESTFWKHLKAATGEGYPAQFRDETGRTVVPARTYDELKRRAESMYGAPVDSPGIETGAQVRILDAVPQSRPEHGESLQDAAQVKIEALARELEEIRALVKSFPTVSAMNALSGRMEQVERDAREFDANLIECIDSACETIGAQVHAMQARMNAIESRPSIWSRLRAYLVRQAGPAREKSLYTLPMRARRVGSLDVHRGGE